MEKKGTVTQISSIFPPEEAQKASKRVHDAFDERQQQLSQLQGFIGDNVSLINVVQKLPDETHHNIMVPFGKAAFFPGQLIHTNEFMVLLGEGHYAERTCKQTVEILKRRGKGLETQVESLKAIMEDLKAEAAFFDTTAEEAAEGLVEIREDYVAEDSSEKSAGFGKTDSTPLVVDNRKAVDEDEDEEYKRLEMVMAKLEKEEEEEEEYKRLEMAMDKFEKEEAADEDEDEEYKRLEMVMAKLEKEEEEAERDSGSDEDEDEQIQNESVVSSTSQNPTDQVVRSSRVPKVEASEVRVVSKDGPSHALNNSTMSKVLELPQDKEKVEAPPTTTNTAFSGSIVERFDNIGMQLPGQQSGTGSSRPVSRFMMQRQRKGGN